MINKVLSFLVFCSLCLGSMRAAQPADTLAHTAGVNPQNTALLIMDLNGNTLAEYNRDSPLIPASIMKSVTIASLVNKLDVNSCYATRVWMEGEVRDTLLDGNLVVVGTGDPSLNSRHTPSNPDISDEIAQALRQRGVTDIRGRIVIDQSLWEGPPTPSSWMAGDLPHAYGTGSHALNFEDNAIGSRSVADPSVLFLNRLRAALARNGVDIGGETIPNADTLSRQLLVEHNSVPLDEIMRSCMMRSDNQYAEALLRTLAVVNGSKGATETGAQLETDYWSKRGVAMQGVKIVDGSGLSRQNRVTANFMSDVLRAMADNPYYVSFFPLAGRDGTLRNFMKNTPLAEYVAMKTGSMNGIQCYAGYKLDDDYQPTHIVVAIFNQMGDRAAARRVLSSILLETFCPSASEVPQDPEEMDNEQTVTESE